MSDSDQPPNQPPVEIEPGLVRQDSTTDPFQEPPSDTNGDSSSGQGNSANSTSNNNESSPSSPSSSSSPLMLYKPPTPWSLLRGGAINFILPFINGLMMGLGELVAHEVAYRFGWNETKVFPDHRRGRSHPIGPGVEVREDPSRVDDQTEHDRELRNAALFE